MASSFDKKMNICLRSNTLLNSSLSSTESIVQDKKDSERELIVSLTTYSKRIFDVHLAIESIAQQTVKPNRLILWLDESEFSLATIPLVLHNQIARGLEVRFCPNYRSYKKLIPTLNLFPDADIITIDDDILYPYDMVEGLVKEHEKYPDCIIAHRVHQMTFCKNNKVNPYNKWKHNIQCDTPSVYNMAIGVGGIFYPKGSLSKECLNIEAFSSLAPSADDVWFKMMTLLNKYKVKKVNDHRDFSMRFLTIEGTQDIALFLNNVKNSANDKPIKNVFEKYDFYDFKD